jgi:hypothetical protein
VCAHVPMPNPGRAQRKETERLHEGEHAAIPEAECGGAVRVDDDGSSHGVQVVVAEEAVMAQVFDAQQASVGGKANLPQRGGDCGEPDRSRSHTCC